MGAGRKFKKTEAVVLSVLMISMFGTTASFAEETGMTSVAAGFGTAAFETADLEKAGLPETKIHAQSAVLMDGKTGRVLWAKNEKTVRPMASTTKIMTCILALEAGLDEENRVAEVSKYAASQPQVHLGMRAGQRFFTRDLLYSLMLESHNDSAAAIAEAAAGSVPDFAARMNEKARELGCEDTWFITPNGLDAKEEGEDGQEHIHSTTAKDLARILSYCVLESPKAEEFRSITRTSDYSFRDADGKGSYSCHNHNALLTMMEGVLSGKTGFTGGAGYCYTAAVEDDGRVFVIALLGCGWPPHKTYKWEDARALISYGKAHYQYRDVYRPIKLSAVPVKNGVTTEMESAGNRTTWTLENCTAALTVGAVNLLEKEPKDGSEKTSLPVLIGDQESVKIRKQLPDCLEAPVRAGEQVGTIDYYLEEEKIASYPILAAEPVELFSVRWCLRQIFCACLL